MLNGSFAKIHEDVTNIRKKINNHEYDHDLEGNEVKAIIQLDNTRGSINNQNIIQGKIIDHRMKKIDELLQDENGSYYIHSEMVPKPVLAGFQIIGNSIVRTFTSSDRDIVLDILSHGLNGTLDLVKPVNFDLQRIFQDYSGHWIGGIFDREGNMQKGTFYGEYIEKDDVIGKCWKKNKKSIIGFQTEYFGNEPSKVRVSLEGGVISYSNVEDVRFLQFVFDELNSYMIDPPRTKRRRNA